MVVSAFNVLVCDEPADENKRKGLSMRMNMRMGLGLVNNFI